MAKNANKCCFLLKTGKEASNLQSFFPSFAKRRKEGKDGSCHAKWSLGHGGRARRPAPARRLGCPAPTASRSWPPYLLSPGLGPCSRMPAEEGPVPPPVLLSALELWGGGSGPAGAKVLPSVGGSGGWKAGDTCFLFRVPPRRWAWKSISFTPKLHREKKQWTTHHASRPLTQKPVGPHVLNPTRGDSHPSCPACSEAARTRWIGHSCYPGTE